MISLKGDFGEINGVETILFDKDGTFVDLHYFWGKMTELRVTEVVKRFELDDSCFDELCNCLGYDANSGKMRSNGITALYSRSKIIEIFRKDLVEFGVITTNEILAEIFDYVSSAFYKDMKKYIKPIPTAITFIKSLKSRGVKTGIVTSDSIESTALTLDFFDWNDLFDVFVGRESSNETKESGALTKIALESLNADPKTTVMIGDAPMDYISAKNASIDATILVATGQIDVEELKQTSKFVLNDLSSLEII